MSAGHGTQPAAWADRYGGHWPDPAAVCTGDCEGTGVVPVYMAAGDRRDTLGSPPGRGLVVASETDPHLIRAWRAAEAAHPAIDGWHFVECPACGENGKTPGQDAACT